MLYYIRIMSYHNTIEYSMQSSALASSLVRPVDLLLTVAQDGELPWVTPTVSL